MCDYPVDLIIINYNTKNLLRDCLRSIKEETDLAAVRVWVVDNGSKDGSLAFIQRTGWVTGIFNRDNKGYAAACNQGIRAGRGRYIFLLNSDLIVTPGWLPPLIQSLSDDERVAVVGPRLVNPSGFLVGVGVIGTDIHPLLRGWGEPDEPHRYNQPTECISLCGACIGIKRSLLPKLGLFDENYFHYFEETDYCYNARLHGYKALYIPNSKVIHLVNGSCRQRGRLNQYFMRSKAYFEEKWHDLLREETIDEQGAPVQTMDCSDLC